MDFFQLTNPTQLFGKMESDLAAMAAAGSDSRLAFNFFVTAEHLPDWLNKRDLVRKHALLRVASHLANGAKHFTLDPRRHNSVSGTSRDTYAEDYAEPGYFEDSLVVHLSADEAAELGKSEYDVLELGKMVLRFWRPYVPGA